MDKKIIFYQIGFWIFYFLDIFTTWINGIEMEGELNPLMIMGESVENFIIIKIIGIFVLIITFYITKKNLLRYSKLAFYIALLINIINILNYAVKT